jgi:RNA polymerase sigma-70 factor (ECF subfamily)
MNDNLYLGAEATASLPRTRRAGRSKAGQDRGGPAGRSLSELELVAQLRAGDEAAFNQLVDRYHGGLVRMALHYVADLSVAEEVVQEAWIGLLEGLGRFEGRSSLKSWLYSIVIHKAKDRGVREKRYVSMTAADDEDDTRAPSCFTPAGDWAQLPQSWDEITPERVLSSKQMYGKLQAAIADLPETLREVLILRDVEEWDAKEICASLKITETNLYVRLHRARERVRAALEQSLGGSRCAA